MSNTAHSTLLVITGVAGSGKTTLASAMAARLGWQFVEADDFHSAEAIARMQNGLPLDDSMRQPWMDRLCEYLRQQAAGGHDCVLAWSGLRRAHREQMRALPFRTRFFELAIAPEQVRQRLVDRPDHFMSPALVESQFETLQSGNNEPDVTLLDGVLPFEALVSLVNGRIQD